MRIGSSRRPWLPLFVLSLLICLLMPATCVAENNCADGGRPRPDEGGIGGTGARPVRPDEGGIGGTGISARADTGIIGTITGFASICVGGVEIHYGARTAVEIDGEPATSTQLARGQVVEVVASGTGSEVSAQQISVRHVVSGPVTGIDPERNEIDVMGQPVRLVPATHVDGGDENSAALATAFPLRSFVRVSGMRQADGTIEASRVTRSEVEDVARLTGPITQVDSRGLAIAGTPIRIDSQVQYSVGEEVHVTGHWDGSALVARSIQSLPRIPFDGRVDRLAIEGYVRPAASGQLRVGSFVVEIPPAASPAPNARVQVEAVVRGHHVIAERIDAIGDVPVLPPRPERDSSGWNGRGPDDLRPGNGDPPHVDQPRPDEQRPLPREGHGSLPQGLPEVGEGGGSSRPDRPPPQMPERAPQMPERPPQMPDRPPQPPERPPRPDRGVLPERPPPRPDIHGRP